MAQTIREIQIASHNAGIAANNIAALSDNANHLVSEEGRPAAQDLRKAIASMQQATDNLNAHDHRRPARGAEFQQIDAAQANRLVQDLRELTQSLQSVSDRVNQQGIGGALGPQKLPDYKPGKRK